MDTKPDLAVVDYSDLVARCMGNLAFAEKILEKFEERLEEDLVLLDHEVNREDAAGIAGVAHKLKGASANVSANGLRDVFSRLEEMGRTGQLEDVPVCMDTLRAEWSRFKTQSPSFQPASVKHEAATAAEY